MTGALPPGAVPVDLDDVPRWSPWPARLLGLEAEDREARTPTSVLREYDRDNYGRLLALHLADPALTVDDLKAEEVGAADVVMSLDERLVVVSARTAAATARERVLDAVDAHLPGASALLDLGCGYGHHLHHTGLRHPHLALRGGEYSPNARELARRLGVDVRAFDAHHPAVDVAEGLGGSVVVLMSMVVSQLPSAALAVDSLSPLRDRVSTVVVVDPVEEVQPASLLGLMRRRYVERNHYSWDLLPVLRGRSDVEVLEVRPNVVGSNFLLPCSVVSWRFR